MGTLLNALQTENTLTTNGMTTNTSSLNHCVDLLFTIGASRNRGKQEVINSFIKAYNENPLIAIKLLFYVRDIRGGAGERKVFRYILEYMANNHSNSVSKNISLISEYGRWDDVLTLLDTPLENEALKVITDGLSNTNKNQLLSKWLPRPSVKNKTKRVYANKIRKHLGLTPKQYRQILSGLSHTVEQAMCSKNWGSELLV